MTPAPSELVDALRAARPDKNLEEHTALAELESRLFARDGGRPRLSRYRLLRPLGSGGMAMVFEAHDPELDRRVAIKLLHWRPETTQLERDRLLHEAQVMARVQHPNVVTVHDVGRYERCDLPSRFCRDVAEAGVFIVMEYIEGTDLAGWLHRQPLPQKILEVFREAGKGIAFAHAQGVVHRDFKPSNVLLGNDGTVKVVDFGLALSDGALEDLPTLDDSDEPTGRIVGTPAYMAPEQQRGLVVDHRADQFAFCASLAEALYGGRVFVGQDLDTLLSAKTTRQHRVTRPRAIPRHVARAVDRGLDPNPHGRFGSMEALLAELRPRRRRSRVAIAGGAAGLVALGAVVAIPFDGGRCREQGETLLGASYSAEQKAAIAQSFFEVDPRHGAEQAERVVASLDRYTDRWIESFERACVAEEPESSPVRACLERRRHALTAVVGALEWADRNLVDHATRATLALDPAEECDLARARPGDADPARRGVRNRLARARALQLSLRPLEARAEAERALANAAALGDLTLAAEARLRLESIRAAR